MFGFFKKNQTGASKDNLGSGGPVIGFLLLEGESFPVNAFLSEAAKTRIAGTAIWRKGPSSKTGRQSECQPSSRFA